MWFCVALFAWATMATAEPGIFRLRSTVEGTWALSDQVVTAEVTSVSARGPVLKTKSGILNLRWNNLFIEYADKAGRESGYFRINKQRIVTKERRKNGR